MLRKCIENNLLCFCLDIFFAMLVAVEMAVLGYWSVHHFGLYRNTLAIIGWIEMTFCPDRPH